MTQEGGGGLATPADYSLRLHERFEECESEKPLRDCHPDEEEEQAGCKPEFEAKVLLGNLRLWRPRVASWNLLCMHRRPLPNKCNLWLLWTFSCNLRNTLCNLRDMPNVH